MADQNLGGTQTSESGTRASNQTDSVDTSNADKKVVSSQEFEHALKDVQKHKSRAKQLETELETVNAKLRQDEESRLAQSNEFKTLAERYKAEADTEKKARKDLENSFFTNQKMSAVRAEALKAGLRVEAESDLDLLSLDGVALERTDHGRMLVHGAEEYVQTLKKQKPHWFSSKQVANVNSGGGNSTLATGEITPIDLFKIEKSGDKKKYYEALALYKKQKQITGGK